MQQPMMKPEPEQPPPPGVSVPSPPIPMTIPSHQKFSSFPCMMPPPPPAMMEDDMPIQTIINSQNSFHGNHPMDKRPMHPSMPMAPQHLALGGPPMPPIAVGPPMPMHPSCVLAPPHGVIPHHPHIPGPPHHPHHQIGPPPPPPPPPPAGPPIPHPIPGPPPLPVPPTRSMYPSEIAFPPPLPPEEPKPPPPEEPPPPSPMKKPKSSNPPQTLPKPPPPPLPPPQKVQPIPPPVLPQLPHQTPSFPVPSGPGPTTSVPTPTPASTPASTLASTPASAPTPASTPAPPPPAPPTPIYPLTTQPGFHYGYPNAPYNYPGAPPYASVAVSSAYQRFPQPTTQVPSSNATTTTFTRNSNLITVTTTTEEPYDPEEAMFSPTSMSPDSPQKDNNEEDHLIAKYVKNVSKTKSPASSLKSPDCLSSEKKKKRVCFAESTKPPAESPARLNLDTRIKMMFGVGDSEEEISPNKPTKIPRLDMKTCVSNDKLAPSQIPVGFGHTLPVNIGNGRPLSPPPSPFLNRDIYLYWHKETMKFRQACKLSSTDFVNSEAPGKGLMGRTLNGVKKGNPPPPPGEGVPPPPKNFLPTKPPPNYENPREMPPEKEQMGPPFPPSSNSKTRSTGRSEFISMDGDSELEMVSKHPEHGERRMHGAHHSERSDDSEKQIVGLVLRHFVEELKRTLRRDLQKELVDRRVMKKIDKIPSRNRR
ncbi:uncharacterized protein LOC143020368 [Oratosquilla oratoria]|uniref:uncharacterized protein LOC143020368 n=1 Tax=Oratosquilla oratoria TaxID=337810 RepID=UPI003F76A092